MLKVSTSTRAFFFADDVLGDQGDFRHTLPHLDVLFAIVRLVDLCIFYVRIDNKHAECVFVLGMSALVLAVLGDRTSCIQDSFGILRKVTSPSRVSALHLTSLHCFFRAQVASVVAIFGLDQSSWETVSRDHNWNLLSSPHSCLSTPSQ